MEDDGVWADDGDEMQQEAAARRESHYNAGYRQGLDEGQHHTIQQGFDAGFADGARTGFLCGQLRAVAVTLEALPGSATPASIAAAQAQRATLRGVVCQGLLLDDNGAPVLAEVLVASQPTWWHSSFRTTPQGAIHAPSASLEDVLQAGPQPTHTAHLRCIADKVERHTGVRIVPHAETTS